MQELDGDFIQSSELVLKRISFNYFPKSFGFGLHSSWNTYNRTYERKDGRVSWLFLSVSFVCWSCEVRFPLKQWKFKVIK